MKTRVTLCVVVIACLSTAPAYGAQVYLSAASDEDGNPVLFAPVLSEEPSVSSEVFRCPGGGACGPVPLQMTTDERGTTRVDLRAAQPGDAFEARFTSADGTVTTARTPRWTGTIVPLTAPAVVGQAVVGQAVSAAGVQWRGGWAYPWQTIDTNLVFACPDATATRDCSVVALSDPVALDARWTGFYLFAYSSRWSAPDPGSAVPAAPGMPFDLDPRFLGSTTLVSAPIGPVVVGAPPAPGVTTRVFADPAAPRATVRPRALRVKGRLSIGRVTCPTRCVVRLTVSSAGRKALRRTLHVTGTKALTIPPRHGKLKVRVVVDGKTVASGTTRAG
jgi:hypothetical protein